MTLRARNKTLVFAGGGTGGHVFPMLAVAEVVRELAPDVELVFVGTERGLEVKAVPARGFALELMRVLPLRGGGVSGFVRGLGQALRAVPEGRALVERLAPAAVLSVGGYAAGPVSLAAWTLGVPLALLEPNSVMGLTNRLVAPLARRGYVAFAEAERHFRAGSVLRAGVPLRPGFEPAPYPAPREDVSSALRLLVLGGSQGAKALNEAVPRALAELKTPLSVVHQCGPLHAEAVRALYAELGLGAVVSVVPFIDDVPAALARADLVVGRSGAGALSEICAVGRPALFVPYPFAAGDHQRVNAEALVRAGGALCIPHAEASPARLAAEIGELSSDRARLATMANRAREFGRPDAARAVASDLLELAGLGESKAPPRARKTNGAVPHGSLFLTPAEPYARGREVVL
jgi:UDP-N-acetylglucosamine--N-acetylmuramyl-(pentapeptide) pyrophosphoryl-undecaprenol N-acetylglucosamine transferase